MENELLSLIPEYIPLGLGVYDKDGYLKYANDTNTKNVRCNYEGYL